MKKIHVVPKGSETIKGYDKVEVSEDGIDMSGVSDNECSFILASDIVDEIPTESITGALSIFVSKMRLGATLITGGTDIRLVSRAVVRGDIKVGDASKLMSASQSCVDLNLTVTILKSLGLTIKSTAYEGFRYEIEAVR
jgi:hypothetical protein